MNVLIKSPITLYKTRESAQKVVDGFIADGAVTSEYMVEHFGARCGGSFAIACFDEGGHFLGHL